MARTEAQKRRADLKWARRVLEPSELIALASELVPESSKPDSHHNNWPEYSRILATAGMILRRAER